MTTVMVRKQPWAIVLVAVLAGSLPKVHQAFVHPTHNSRHKLMGFSARDALRLNNNNVLSSSRSPRGTTLFVAAPRESKNKNQSPKDAKPDQEEEDESTIQAESEQSTAPPRFTPPPPHEDEDWVGTVRGSRFRKLKDMIWIRETVEDLTAAEFACSVELASLQDPEDQSGRKRRRAVDYDKLLGQLNKRLRDMGCLVDDNDSDAVFCELDSGIGMGTTVYDEEQREELYE